jgi:hypothetical protein
LMLDTTTWPAALRSKNLRRLHMKTTAKEEGAKEKHRRTMEMTKPMTTSVSDVMGACACKMMPAAPSTCCVKQATPHPNAPRFRVQHGSKARVQQGSNTRAFGGKSRRTGRTEPRREGQEGQATGDDAAGRDSHDKAHHRAYDHVHYRNEDGDPEDPEVGSDLPTVPTTSAQTAWSHATWP